MAQPKEQETGAYNQHSRQHLNAKYLVHGARRQGWGFRDTGGHPSLAAEGFFPSLLYEDD